MHQLTRTIMSRRAFFGAMILALAVALTFLASTPTIAGGYGERLVNGGFEEGFNANGVAAYWTGFYNGGSAFFHFQDDVSPAFNYDGKHSQLFEISTVQYAASEQERYAGIYQTIGVAAGTAYTLTLHGMLRVLPNDSDMNNWAYVVQWGIDPNGGTDWGQVAWQTVPWQNTYDWQRPGPLSDFATTFNAPSNKITLFVRALKKFPTVGRDLFVNIDGVSLLGLTPADGKPPTLSVIPPTLVYTTKPFPVHVTASDSSGLPQIRLFDEDKLVATVSNAVGPLLREFDFAWTPTIPGTRTLKVEATNTLGMTTAVTQTVNVVPIVEFLKNGNFEGGFRSDGVALQWEWFNNGGRNVTEQLYDDIWAPVISSGKHSQLIEISTIGQGYLDPYAESDRYAGICQVVSGLTPKASYYVSGKGIIRITEGDQYTDDWSWVAQWGYLVGEDPQCAQWTNVSNWQVLPWAHVDFRESPSKLNSFTTVIFPQTDKITVYFRAWKKWAVGAREFLVNFDDVSVAGYKEPPPPTPTPTATPTATATPSPAPTATATPGK